MDWEAVVAITLVIGPFSALVFSWSPIGRAITDRIRGHSIGDRTQLDEIRHMVCELQESMDSVGAHVDDMQDRLSFAERLLTASAEREKEFTPV